MAVHWYGRAIAHDPDDAANYYFRGAVSQQTGDLPGAVEDLTEAVRSDPGRLEAWYARAVTYRDLGESAKALDDIDELHRRHPGHVNGWHVKGELPKATGNLPGAIAAYETAVRYDPGAWMSWANLGVARCDADQRDAAFDALTTGYRTCPDPAARQQIAGMITRRGGQVPR